MKKIIILLIALMPFVGMTQCKQDWTWDFDWTVTTGTVDNDLARILATDKNGNSYAIGGFTADSITFGSTTLYYSLSSFDQSNGVGSSYFVKYDSSGNIMWAKSFAGVGANFVKGIVVDNNDDIYISGSVLIDSIDLGSGIKVYRSSFFLAKFNKSGDVLWADNSTGNTSSNSGRGLAVDEQNNVYVTGVAVGTVIPAALTIGGFTLPTLSLGESSIFLVKYTPGGTALWSGLIASNGVTFATEMAVNSSGETYVVGISSGDSLVGGGFIAPKVGTVSNSYDMYISKFDKDGNVIRLQRYGDNLVSVTRGVVVDDSDNLYLVGDFGGDTLIVQTDTLFNRSSNNYDMFFVKFDKNGQLVWLKSFGNKYQDGARGMTMDHLGNIHVTGIFVDTSITFDSITLTNNGRSDFYIATFDQDGKALSALSVGGAGQEGAYDIAPDQWGNLYYVGFYGPDAATFGTTTLGTTVGEVDMYVGKLKANVPTVAPNNPIITISSDTLISSSATTYQWVYNGDSIVGANNKEYVFTDTGNYYVQVTDSSTGCLLTSNIVRIDSMPSSTGTGIETTEGIKIKIYPNPNSGQFYVEVGEQTIVTIYNILGEQILQSNVQNKLYVNIEEYGAGIYFVKIGNNVAKLVLE